MPKSKEKTASAHPWRDNIEAITMAIVMAVMLKYFIVEAYKIPTGSMQPTLMGNDETAIKDRILVDKFSYHFREPERWEVTVFKYPLDLSKNFIKRMVGVGPEQLKIENGDLWNRPDANAEWKVLRRPRPVQEEVWKRMYPGQDGLPGWKALGGASSWAVDETTILAKGDGSLRYPPNGSVMDDYRHGYPLSIRSDIRSNPRASSHPVGDLRIEGSISALEGCESVVIELREGSRRYRFTLPGPAAGATPHAGISAKESVSGQSSPLGSGLEVATEEPWQLEAGSDLCFAVQNMDDLLQLELDGEIVLQLEIPAAKEHEQNSCVYIHVEGEGAALEDLKVLRDIYYISNNVKRHEWDIPEGHYVMLGDNTQDSSDSREWRLYCVRYPKGEDGTVYRGNLRENNVNPRNETGGPGGTIQWFRDEFGELHHWPLADAKRLGSEELSMVPRDLITGRAVVVFWPFKPSYRLWRLQWVH